MLNHIKQQTQKTNFTKMTNLALLHHYNWGRRRKRWYRQSFGGSSLRINYSILEITVIFNIILLLFLKPSNAIAPKYETAYACEGKTLAIECENGNLINLIRANYGRFSITICNDHGNTDWSVNCMSPKSLRVLHSKCAHKQNCSVLASTNMFGDPCPGTHKYLEAHYLCVSEASQQTSTTNTPTTNRLSPPWILTSQPSIWSTSTVRYHTTSRIVHLQTVNTQNTTKTIPMVTVTTNPKVITTTTSSTLLPRNKYSIVQSTLKPNISPVSPSLITSSSSPSISTTFRMSSTTQPSTIYQSLVPSIATPNLFDDITTQVSIVNTNPVQKENYFCKSRMARNLFWNITRVGEINVQPCPGGATGLAKWRCVFDKITDSSPTSSNTHSDTTSTDENIIKIKPVWQYQTPDLTLCRSLWLNSLEIRVNHRDSSLISIANDLSQVTSSKTLYGGDMLVTTKIIQTMSEKMTYDIETFPDQRQREAIVYELLLGVVKTGSNLLDQSQHLSWLDLSFEDQMRVATSLLTGLEDNAFLLADTIVRERNVVQKVKNILLSVRVLETRNIVGNEIFPDSNVEQWNVSDDRIELPRGALIENSDGGLVRIVFVAFDRLESILRPTNIVGSDSSTQNNNKYSKNISLEMYSNDGTQPPYVKKRILNSKVISASLGKGRHIQLSQPIRLVLKHLKTENVTNPSCVFWNYIDHAWSGDGCYVEQTNDTHTICTCNHLTNFAILMDIVDEKLSETYKLIDDKILILIYISIAICIIFIIIAILTLKLFNGIFIKSNRTTIYKNLYMCLLTIEILFLIGIELNEIHVLCGFTSAFLHCSFLCAIAWIFFEGFQLYVMLTTDDMLLDGEKSSKTIWYYLLTYGLSFTIVAIALWINPNTYTQADYCIWMEKNNIFYFTFLAPIIFFILANLVYSAMAFFIMCKKYKTSLKNKEHTRLASVRFYLRCSVIFLIIFTGVWTFGYLYMESIKFNDNADKINPNIYGYIFVILNSFQGIFIFVFHFIQNDKVRHEYYKLIRQNKWLPKCFKCNKTNNNNNSNINNNVTSSQTNSPNSQIHEQGDSGNCISNTINNRTIKPNRSQISSTSSISINSSNLIYNTNNGNSSNINNSSNNNDWNYLQQGGGGGGSGTGTSAVDGVIPTSFATLNHHHNRNKTLSKFQMGSGVMTGTLNVIGQPQSGTVSMLNQDDCYYWTNHSNNNSNINNNNTLGNAIYPSYKKKNKYSYDTSTMNPSSHHQQQSSTDCQFQSRTLNPQANQFVYKLNYLNDHQPPMHQQPQPVASRNIQHYPHIIGADNIIVGGSTSGLVQVPGSNVENSNNYFDEPVYEEIVSNRPNYDDYVDDDEIEIHRQQQQHQRRVQQHHRRHDSNSFNPNKLDASDDDNDDDDDDDDDDDVDDDLEDFGNEDEDLIDENYRIRDMLSNTRDNRNKKLKYAYPSAKSQPAINDIHTIEELQGHQAAAVAQQQQQFGRNLSAILDENNTVICYLEPISKN